MLGKFLNKHLQYAKYVFRHRWFVFVEAVKLGIPYRGLLHDLSKFRPDEWFPYVETFYGEGRDKLSCRRAFDAAWLRHIHRNPHHWQFWLLQEDDGPAKCLEMPESVLREMIADWRGAGQAQGKGNDITEWFNKNHHVHQLHPKTRCRLYELLERYDLLLGLLLEHQEEFPPGVLGVGIDDRGILFVVEDLLESKKSCCTFFRSLIETDRFPTTLSFSVLEEDQPHTKPKDFQNISQ